jgi:cystathionine beta-lyase/cystathionine gamma-synthase
VNHSASQSHSGMSHEVKEALGIREGLLRFSAGIEDIDDIWDDINHALNQLM